MCIRDRLAVHKAAHLADHLLGDSNENIILRSEHGLPGLGHKVGRLSQRDGKCGQRHRYRFHQRITTLVNPGVFDGDVPFDVTRIVIGIFDDNPFAFGNDTTSLYAIRVGLIDDFVGRILFDLFGECFGKTFAELAAKTIRGDQGNMDSADICWVERCGAPLIPCTPQGTAEDEQQQLDADER